MLRVAIAYAGAEFFCRDLCDAGDSGLRKLESAQRFQIDGYSSSRGETATSPAEAARRTSASSRSCGIGQEYRAMIQARGLEKAMDRSRRGGFLLRRSFPRSRAQALRAALRTVRSGIDCRGGVLQSGSWLKVSLLRERRGQQPLRDAWPRPRARPSRGWR